MRKFMIFGLALSFSLLLASCGKQADNQAQKSAADSVATAQNMPESTTTQQPVAEKPAIQEETKKSETVSDNAEKAKKDKDQTQSADKKSSKEGAVVADKKAEKPKQAQSITIPDSTEISVTLIDSIDTDVQKTGDTFKGELTENIVVGGNVIFEKGAVVFGTLNKVVESGHLKTPAELEFSLVSIADKSGTQVPVSTYVIAEKKGSHTTKDVGLIGGGAVVGGIIGKLSGKKGGTAIGAAAGAAAGAGAAAATGKQDIVHSAGTEVKFTLKQPVFVEVKE